MRRSKRRKKMLDREKEKRRRKRGEGRKATALWLDIERGLRP